MRSSEQKLIISQLSEQLTTYEQRYDKLCESELRLMDASKDELNELTSKWSEGVIFRTKSKWAMEGEKSTKYFLNLEKSRYNAKCTTCLLIDGEEITDNHRILVEQQKYYQDLYTSNPNISFHLEDDVTVHVTEEMAAASESQFSKEEISQAVKDLKNGSCPGSDGIPIEVYKVFWRQIRTTFYNAIIQIYKQGRLHDSAHQGVLNLIPKGQKDTHVLKNLRPISLLNSDYKVIEKLIANRMVPALEYVIHEDQKGYLPGRKIAANIRKILDVTVTSRQEQKDGFILSCDYMKCFDRCEIFSIQEAMKQFHFSKILLQWVEIVYKDFQLKVQNCGHFSKPILVTRSVRQGGPASNALFLVVAELLAIKIRKDPKIKGIFLKEVLHLLNQFADDMDVSAADEESLVQTLSLIEQFGKSTGFKLNYDKTTVYRVGSLREAAAKYYSTSQLHWTDKSINVLGVHIFATEEQQVKTNYEELINKAQSILTSWENRSLSLYGKLSVINTLVSSLFVYQLTSLPSMLPRHITQLNTMMEKYIWNGHRPKIRLDVLQSLKEDGGAGLTHFEDKDASIKATWIKSLVEEAYNAKFVYETLHPIGSMIWCCNLSPSDVVKVISCENVFWKDVLTSWCKYHYTSVLEKSPQIVWLNSNITQGGTPLWWKTQCQNGLMYVSDLFGETGWKTSDEVMEEFKLTSFQYSILKAAIPKQYKRYAEKNYSSSFSDVKFSKFMHAENTSRYVYHSIRKKSEKIEQVSAQWMEELLEEVDIHEYVQNIQCQTYVSKYRSFQYRLLMRSVVTNVHLFRWGILPNNKCSFCVNHVETPHHMLFDCSFVRPLWEEVKTICHNLKQVVEITYPNVILNRISGRKTVAQTPYA